MTLDEDDRPHARALRSAIHLAHKLRLATLARETVPVAERPSQAQRAGKG